MSVVATVAAVGAVTVSSKLFAGMAAAAAASLGMRAARAVAEAEEEERIDAVRAAELAEAKAAAEVVEVSPATEAALAEAVAERCELHFTDGVVDLVVTRDIRGKVTVRAHAHGLSRAEVTDRASRFLSLLQQQVAYHRVMHELRLHGFAAAEEERAADGTVRVRIRRKRS
ncbi:MAG: DUF1257 domain-containing protein [Deltaproteobacteria bacterium]|nr:MAG: DUF1257 domain-containing protein [Deltaproteobacteria bacterium]